MSQFSGSPLQRFYALTHSSVGTVPNSTGTFTATGMKFIPHIKATLRRLTALIAAEYKTGTASMLSGIAGKNSATFDCEIDLMPSGAAGTAPNCAPILANIFGAAGTVVSSTSVTYNLTDGSALPLILALWNESGSGNTSQFLYGGVTQSWSANIGGAGSVRLSFQGMGFYCLDSDNETNEDTVGLGGLTSTPAEPSSPALSGNMIPSFAQTITIGGSSTVEFRSATLKGSTGRELRTDGIGYYPDASISQGRRSVSLSSLKFQDSDGTALTAVKNAAKSKTATDVVITQGNVAGYIMTWTIKGVQFGNYTFSESGANVEISFDDSPAHASAVANLNEVKLALT